MEVSQGGVSLGATKIDLGKPDEQGRIQYLGTIPAGALSPGDYTIRLVLQQGSERAQEAAFFTVAPSQGAPPASASIPGFSNWHKSRATANIVFNPVD